jgi:branched-subunit amino acid ABC-type transport system permease component
VELIVQVLITGLSVGAVYGLFAICIAVIYRLTGVIHLALGELAGACVFVTLWVTYGRGAVAGTTGRVPFALGGAAALAITVGLGAVIYLLAIRPFIHRQFSLGWIGGIVAAAVTLRGAIEAFFPRESYTLPDPLPVHHLGNDGVIALANGATLQVRVIFVGLIAIALALIATWALEHSRWGSGLRAISEDRLAAALAGVPIERSLLIAFAATAGIAGAAALLALPGAAITIDTPTLLGLKGLVAAVAAGFGHPRRVLGFALGLGLLETAIAVVDLGPFELGAAYRDVIPIALVVLFMALRPQRTVLQEDS